MKGQQPAAIGCAQRVTALHLDHEQSDVGFHDEIHLDASRGTPGGEASVPLPRGLNQKMLRVGAGLSRRVGVQTESMVACRHHGRPHRPNKAELVVSSASSAVTFSKPSGSTSHPASAVAAIAASCARLVTPSLLNTCARWAFTVSRAMNGRSAICSWLNPSVTSSTTRR